MNYGGAGGAGQYGQPPMGAMGQMGQQMHPGMMPQGPNAAANMHRMMQLQQSGRGMPPGGMYPQMQGQHPMMHQQGVMGYPPGMPGMAQQRINPDIINKFPVEWRQNLAQEKNQERKRQMLTKYCQQYTMIQGQNMMGAQHMAMGNAGMLPPGQHNGMPPMGFGQPGMPGAGGGMPMSHMGAKGVMPNNAAMQQQIRMQQAQAASQMSGQPGGSAIAPQVAALQSHSAATGSPATMPAPGQLTVHGSPQVQQPVTPQNPSSVQPGSVSDTKPASVAASEITPEYASLLGDLRGQYLEQLKRIGDRCRLDNMPMPKGYIQLMEILHERRTVDTNFLKRVCNSAKSLLDRASLSFPIMDEIRRVPVEDGKPKIQSPLKPGQPDPWNSVRHLFIRVPDDVLKAVETPNASPRTGKRGHEEEENHDGMTLKVPKLELDTPTKVKKELETTPEKPAKKPVKPISIDCMFSKGKKWQMGAAASEELVGIPWRIDPETVPPSWRSPDVTVCFDAKILMVPPLRVMIPASYPTDPCVVLFDRSFPMGMQLSAQLATLFERRLSLASTRSITCIYESFNHAVQELVRLKNKAQNARLAPTAKHRQKQLVA